MWTKFKSFWRAAFFSKAHSLSNLYYKTKGVFFYRLFFKQFGRGACIRNPLLILNPSFICIGNRVAVRDGVRLEVVRSVEGRIPQLVIGDDTNIEQNVHIVCHSRVVIGRNVSITANCAIVDVTHPFSAVNDQSKVGARILDEDSFVEIGSGAFIGFGSVILPNVRVGTNAVVGANSVVTRDVPDYSVVGGVPAVVLKRYDFSQQAWVKVNSSSDSRT